MTDTKPILIFADAERKNTREFVELVKKNFKNKETQIELGVFKDLSFQFGNGELTVKLNGKDITEYRLVYFRKAGRDYTILANTMALCLQYLEVPFFDSQFGTYGARGNKLTSLVRLFTSGLQTPKTI